MTAIGHDTLATRSTLDAGGLSVAYYSLDKAAAKLGDVSRLPFSMKVLLEKSPPLRRRRDRHRSRTFRQIVDWQKRSHARRAKSNIVRRAC